MPARHLHKPPPPNFGPSPLLMASSPHQCPWGKQERPAETPTWNTRPWEKRARDWEETYDKHGTGGGWGQRNDRGIDDERKGYPGKMKGRAGARRRGGRYQQQFSLTNSSPSKLGENLIDQYCFGAIQAVDVQENCSCAWQDGLYHPQIQKLASLGSWGVHPGNTDRDLKRYIESYVNLPKYSKMQIR